MTYYSGEFSLSNYFNVLFILQWLWLVFIIADSSEDSLQKPLWRWVVFFVSFCWVKHQQRTNQEQTSSFTQQTFPDRLTGGASWNWSAYITVSCSLLCLLCFKSDQVHNSLLQPRLESDPGHRSDSRTLRFPRRDVLRPRLGSWWEKQTVPEVYCPDAIVSFFGAQLFSLACSK